MSNEWNIKCLSVYCFKLMSCAVVQHSMTTIINDCYDIHCCSDLNRFCTVTQACAVIIAPVFKPKIILEVDGFIKVPIFACTTYNVIETQKLRLIFITTFSVWTFSNLVTVSMTPLDVHAIVT